MRRPDTLDGVLVACAVGFAWLTSPRDDSHTVTLVWATIVGTLLLELVRLGASTGRSALVERRRARLLAEVEPTEAALAAVHAERERLSTELDECISSALRDIRETAAASGLDPGRRADLVHHRAREATAELRRQLGLLRTEPDAQPSFGRSVRLLPAQVDLLLVVAAVFLAVAETWLATRYDPVPDYGPTSVLLTALAAACIGGRRRFPAWAALVCAGLMGVAWLLPGVQVLSGSWKLITVAGLIWVLCARPTGGRLLVVSALGGVSGASRLDEDPANAGVAILTAVLAAVLGAAVGRNRRQHASAASAVASLEAGLDRARLSAVAAERQAVARELHDVVSHAVGVIAAQAAAATVSWPRDPAAAERALAVVADTSAAALREFRPDAPGGPEPDEALEDLVARMRATGTPVTLSQSGALPRPLAPVVHRIVQEGLTNALKHAPGSPVEVCIDAAGRVSVRVSNRGGPHATRRGFGLTGIAERVELAGGTMSAARRLDGRFVLDVTFPRSKEHVS